MNGHRRKNKYPRKHKPNFIYGDEEEEIKKHCATSLNENNAYDEMEDSYI